MKKRRKIAAVSILLAAACIVAFVLWYQAPVHRRIELDLYDDNGTAAAAQFDIAIRRSVLPDRSDSLRGSIAFDGKRYETTDLYGGQSNYFYEVNQLQEGGTMIEIMQNSIFLFYIEFAPDYSSFELLAMSHKVNGEAKTWRSYIQ